MRYGLLSLWCSAAAMCAASQSQAADLTYTGSYSVGAYSATYSIIAPGTVGTITAGILSATTTFSGPDFATYTTTATYADLYINVYGPDVHPLFVTSQSVGGNTVYSLNFDFTVTNGIAAIFDSSPSAPVGGISLCFQANMTPDYSDYGCNFSTSANAGFQDYSHGAFDFSNPVTVGTAVIATATVAAAAVPEPATWTTLILGFGIVGVAVRRRKAAVRVRFA